MSAGPAVTSGRVLNAQNDLLRGAPIQIEGASLLDFWMWAFRDLCDDDVKGIFAEWIVLKLLDLPRVRRCSWANNDLVTDEGVTIEVKASAHWQSWKLLDGKGTVREKPLRPMTPRSKVVFAGLKRRESEEPNVKAPAVFKSQIYIFAFQHEVDPIRWNAMDLSQWEFYVLRASDLAGASIKLLDLQTMRQPLNATEFRSEALRLIQEVSNGSKS